VGSEKRRGKRPGTNQSIQHFRLKKTGASRSNGLRGREQAGKQKKGYDQEPFLTKGQLTKNTKKKTKKKNRKAKGGDCSQKTTRKGRG